MLKWIIPAGLVLLFGCTSNRPEEPQTALKIAVNDIYCMDTACFCVHDVASRTYTEVVEKIASETGIALEFVYFPETYQLEDALATGAYDGALCKPWFAFRNQSAADADFRRILDLLDPHDNRWLTGIVIVSADSPITALEELDGRHLFIGQEDAYEKHYAALRLLKEKNIEPARIDSNASCSENIGVLMDGLADAAVVSDYALSADCAVDFARPEDFRILAHTEKIPLTSLMLDMNRVSDEDAKKLKQAFLALSGSEAPEAFLGSGFVEPAPWNPPEMLEDAR